MMCDELKRGSVVRSAAGRNKGKVMCVLKVEKNFVYAADGKEYSVAQPKLKNMRHIEPTGAVISNEELLKYDSRLRRALADLNKIDS